MSLQTIVRIGDTVFITTTHTKADGQVGTPSTVNVAVALRDPSGALVDPAPSATVNVVNGVATAVWSVHVGDTSAEAAGSWYFHLTGTGDLVFGYDGCFHVPVSVVV